MAVAKAVATAAARVVARVAVEKAVVKEDTCAARRNRCNLCRTRTGAVLKIGREGSRGRRLGTRRCLRRSCTCLNTTSGGRAEAEKVVVATVAVRVVAREGVKAAARVVVTAAAARVVAKVGT